MTVEALPVSDSTVACTTMDERANHLTDPPAPATPNRLFAHYTGVIKSSFSLPLEFERLPDSRFDAFRASAQVRQVGDVLLGHLESEAYLAHMPGNRHGKEMVSLCFLEEGTVGIAQDGRFSLIQPGQAFLFNTARPAEFQFLTPFKEYIVRFPRKALEQYCFFSDRYTASGFHRTSDMDLLRNLVIASIGTTSMETVAPGCLDQLAQTFGTLAGRGITESFEDARRFSPRPGLLTRVQDFMRRNIDNTLLTPRKIAEANSISLRTLHTLFEENGDAVMRWLWEARLNRAKELLAYPICPAHPTIGITDIAQACGFKTTAHFSPRFKKRFGMTPNEYRKKFSKRA